MKTTLLLATLLGGLQLHADEYFVLSNSIVTGPYYWTNLGPAFQTTSQVIERHCVRSNATYIVKYEYNPGICSIPATMPPGQPHYDAKITVWLNGKQAGREFTGTVTPNGCFEDVPCDQVDKALKKEIIMGEIVAATNGANIKSIGTNLLVATNALELKTNGLIISAAMTNFDYIRIDPLITTNAWDWSKYALEVICDTEAVYQWNTNCFLVPVDKTKLLDQLIKAGELCKLRTTHDWQQFHSNNAAPWRTCKTCTKSERQEWREMK